MAGRHSGVKPQPRVDSWQPTREGSFKSGIEVKSEPRYLGCYEKIKGPGTFAFPARAISIKNEHLLVIYSIPARGFTAAVSVFRGTPPPKPLICKSVSNHLGARLRSRWADPTGGLPRHSCALIRLALSDIIETSLCYYSQTVHLSLPPFHHQFQGNKKPCLHGVSRV